ncbi:MAG: protein-ADP-ribose hydrolase [Actinobacteria bacterium]|nr:protein-ADP-ribose hydrolase [Actinomycetota bacterium]
MTSGTDIVEELIAILVQAMPQYDGVLGTMEARGATRRQLLRGMMNLCPPMVVPERYYVLQDILLSQERDMRGVVVIADLPTSYGEQVYLWHGDILRLGVDAIVNAANSELLGCRMPGHHCIDNAIHSAAGLQVRNDCATIMSRQKQPESTGKAKVTKAYNLPSQWIIHTVGPIVVKDVTLRQKQLLAQCYTSCLEAAAEQKCESLAFCCISTGIFGFPKEEASIIATETVSNWMRTTESSIERVVFCVFTDEDEEYYKVALKNMVLPQQ